LPAPHLPNTADGALKTQNKQQPDINQADRTKLKV
jgi:hypothetical protein